MDAAQLRPLSVGEILDAAIKIFRQRFSHMVKAVAVVVAPVAVISALVQLSLAPSSDEDIFAPIDQTTGQTTVDESEVWGFVAGALIAGILTYVAAQLATAACLKLVAGAYLDEAPDWRTSLASATGRLGSLVWLSMALGLALLLGFLACIAPGVYLYIAFTVAVPVLMLEDLRGFKALRRSRELVRGRWWSALGVVVVSTILAFIAQMVLTGILLAVVRSGDNELVNAVAGAVAGTAGSVLTTPFAAAAIMVLYFDLRVRKEGFDLELLAGRVGVEPPARSFAADDEWPRWGSPPGSSWDPAAPSPPAGGPSPAAPPPPPSEGFWMTEEPQAAPPADPPTEPLPPPFEPPAPAEPPPPPPPDDSPPAPSGWRPDG